MRLYPDAVNSYITDPTSGLNTESSRAGYRVVLRSLQLHNPDKLLVDFTEDDLVSFIGRPHLSPASKAGYRTRIHGFFSWANWRGLIIEDPSVNLKRLVPGSQSKPVTEHHWLGLDDMPRVFDSIDTETVTGRRTMMIARLGFTVGLRRAEIAGLTWSGVDLDRQSINIVGKGQKRASLFITGGTLPWFKLWHDEALEGLGYGTGDLQGSEPVIPKIRVTTDFRSGWERSVLWDTPITGDMVGKIIREAAGKAGIVFRAHDMRRSFANMLEERGATIEEISAALRHSNLGTTQRYMEKRQDAAFQAVKARGLDI
jgi:integrase